MIKKYKRRKYYESNRAILSNKCQEIIYKEWGFSTDYWWKLVDETVEELLPDNMD